MYTCDEVIASGYFVFGDKLSCHIVGILLSEFKLYNMSLNNNKLVNLVNEFTFQDSYYKLNEGADTEKVSSYIRGELVILLNGIKWQLEYNEKQKQLIKE